MKQVKRGEAIYRKIESLLSAERGKFIAIDTASGDYFVATDALEACSLGRKKHPSRQFYLKRIGTRFSFLL